MQFFFHVSDDATDACERIHFYFSYTCEYMWKLETYIFYIEELSLATEAQYIMGL